MDCRTLTHVTYFYNQHVVDHHRNRGINALDFTFIRQCTTLGPLTDLGSSKKDNIWNWQIYSKATCISGPTYSWVFNTRGQSPCDLASGMGALCNSGSWVIDSLRDQNKTLYDYTDPSPVTNSANMCTCSSVYYCLMSACSYCQGGGLSSWSTYHANCNDTDVSLASFPKSLPSGVSIPQWAFMDVTEKDILDIDLARSIAENAVPTSSGSHRKRPSVAIVLGCIFAAVVLLASFGFNAYRIWKKKRGSLQQILGEDCVPYPISPPPTPPPAKAGLRDSVTANASWVGQLNAVHATRAKIRASTPAIDNFAINEVQRPQQQVSVNQIPPDYDPPLMQPPSYESLQEHRSGA